MWGLWGPEETGENEHRQAGGTPAVLAARLREGRGKPKREGEEETRVDVVDGSVGLPGTLPLTWVVGSCDGGGRRGRDATVSPPVGNGLGRICAGTKIANELPLLPQAVQFRGDKTVPMS
jgi:hypothetical protein